MLGRQIKLFNLLGFSVKIDLSWIIIAFLVTWSLAEGVFPFYYRGFPASVYWWMGISGALGLFLSIIIHEFSHSLVARKFGMPMRGITLFIFGGIAEMDEEPPSPKSEFFMAVAGPLASVALGFIFYGISAGGIILGLPTSVTGVLGYLGWINWLLAGFNLIPAFPLDGGRVLRSALWRWKGNIRWATQIASGLGSGFGFLLGFLGVLSIFSGAFISGLWWILIGLFINSTSKMSYQRLIITRALEGEPVSRFMKSDVITTPSSIPLTEFVEDYVYRHHYRMFPVMDHNILKGYVTTMELKHIPKDQWDQYTVGQVTKPCSVQNTVRADTDAVKALSLMNTSGNSRLLVVENGHLKGIVTLKDLLRFLSIKMDLEGEDADDLSAMNERKKD